MRFLALIGALAIIAVIAAAIYFFGGFYNVAETEDNPAIVDWALASVRGASVVAHGTETPPANLDDAETVKAGARIYSTIGCVNCHGGPPDANWAKWSEGLKPVPADLKVMAKERTASQLFWAIKNGIKFTGMPSFGLAGASDQDLWSIVAFVKKSPSVSDDEYKAWTTAPSTSRPSAGGRSHIYPTVFCYISVSRRGQTCPFLRVELNWVSSD